MSATSLWNNRTTARLHKAALATTASLFMAAFAQAQTAWVATNNAVFNAAAAPAQYVSAPSANQPISITVTLKLNNKAALDALVAAQHTPGSSSYHQWLTNAQNTQNFAPTAVQAQAVANYLTQKGFTHVQISPSRMLVTATGTAALAQAAFNTALGVYTQNGQTGMAPASQVQVPAGLSQIDQVLGLNTVNRMRTFPVRAAQSLQAATASSCLSAGQTPPCTSTGNAAGYYPNEFANVYNRPASQTGRSTTAAIIGWGNMTNPATDLQQFEALQGLSAVPYAIVYPAADTVGSSSNDDSGQSEWGMDAQAIVGMSGGVQKLIFYSAGGTYTGTYPNGVSSGSFDSELYKAIDQAVSDNTAKVINMSWGSCELGSGGYFDNLFEQGISQGQTFVAATGDYGNMSGLCSSTAASVSYPASSPYVIAIGGTTLTTATNLAYAGESAWNNIGKSAGGATGGGLSSVESRPAWQSAVPGSYTGRELPDLAFEADPYTGAILYYTASSAFGIAQSGWQGGWGGTSLAAPLFTGAWAVLQSANSNNLGFAPQWIYANITPLNAAQAIHDVSSGNNGYNPYVAYGNNPVTPYYNAIVGYDMATGWGSFDITRMLAFLSGTSYYTVTASVSNNVGGTISPASANVKSGATQTFTLAPNANYQISSVGGTCGGTLSGNTYTTKAITANCTVVATFVSATYTVTASAGTGGSISPTGAIAVAAGTSKTFTLVPSTGYKVSSIGGTCGGTLSGNSYTTRAITASCTVTAAFAQVPAAAYTVTASAGTGGTISPAGAVAVAAGTSKTFTVTPSSGYSISSVGGTCGGTLSGNTYTTNAINGNCTVAAAFTQTNTTYTVTASAGTDGSINPAGAIAVAAGTSKTFTVTPNSGYMVSYMGGTCGGTLSGNTYTTKAINGSCTVTAMFIPLTAAYSVTFNAGIGGRINPSGTILVSPVGWYQFSVSANSGYYISIVSGCNAAYYNTSPNVLSAGYSIAPTSNCTVTATFVQK